MEKEIRIDFGLQLNMALLNFDKTLNQAAMFARIAGAFEKASNIDELMKHDSFIKFVGTNNITEDKSYFVEMISNYSEYAGRYAFIWMMTGMEEYLRQIIWNCTFAKSMESMGGKIELNELSKIASEKIAQLRKYTIGILLEKVGKSIEIWPPPESHVLNDLFKFVKLRNAIVHRAGKVSNEDLNQNNKLVVKINELGIFSNGMGIFNGGTVIEKGNDVIINVISYHRFWYLGDEIELSSNLSQNIAISLRLVAQNLAQNVKDYIDNN